MGDSHPSQWSTTAASNTTVGGSVNIAENCPMPGMNNALRAEMAGVVGALSFQATSDSNDVYTATLAPAPDAYVQKFPYFVYFGTANTTTTPTLNLNSIGAKTIIRNDGRQLQIGDLNGPHILSYDGTNMRVHNPVILARTTQDSITAHAGGGGTSATAITADEARVTTCASDDDSVKLPAAVAGRKITIFNSAGHIVAVYAAGADVFWNSSSFIEIANGSNWAMFICYTTGTWVVPHNGT